MSVQYREQLSDDIARGALVLPNHPPSKEQRDMNIYKTRASLAALRNARDILYDEIEKQAKACVKAQDAAREAHRAVVHNYDYLNRYRADVKDIENAIVALGGRSWS